MSGAARAEALQADLVSYHDSLSRDPGRLAGEADKRVVARCVEALRDTRAAAGVIMAGAIDLLESGQPAAARALLQSVLHNYQDRPEGAPVQ